MTFKGLFQHKLFYDSMFMFAKYLKKKFHLLIWPNLCSLSTGLWHRQLSKLCISFKERA